MRIAVSGSIATDHLMMFPGKFADQFVDEQMDNVSLSFLVDELEIRKGGVAANIAFGLGSLGMYPVLVGAVGPDFDEYRTWLESHGVDTKSVHVSQKKHTARFTCTTDETQNQIASFYAGAMSEAVDVDLGPIADRTGGLDLVLVAPDDPDAMVKRTEECRAAGYPFAADPSQQLARMDGDAVRKLVEGAAYLFTNEYETALLKQGTGWSHDEVLDRVGSWVMTHGGDGVVIESKHHDPVKVDAVPDVQAGEPTGVGDAFRAGFLWGLDSKLTLERSAQVGCTLASIVLETVGTQEYTLDRSNLSDRVARAYGGDAAAEIESKLRV